jgi:hypothetical protein
MKGDARSAAASANLADAPGGYRSQLSIAAGGPVGGNAHLFGKLQNLFFGGAEGNTSIAEGRGPSNLYVLHACDCAGITRKKFLRAVDL